MVSAQNYLIIGLGNPGGKHLYNRHNIGWQVFDYHSELAAKNWTEKFKGAYTSLKKNGKTFYFLKPLTFMNNSGESAQPLAAFFKIPLENILVIYDELDIDFGSLVFKRGGGVAGHNGLRSLVQHLGGEGFGRIRMGISRPQDGNISKWVLSDFNSAEKKVIEDFYLLGVQALDAYMSDGFEKSSNKFSRQSIYSKGK